MAQLAIVGAIVFFGWRFVRQLDLDLLRSRVGDVGAGALAVMVAGMVARIPVWTERWLFVVRSVGLRVGRARAMGSLAAGMAVNTVLPTARIGGGLVRARYLATGTRRGFGAAYGTILVDQLLHHSSLAACAVIVTAAIAGALGLGREALAALAVLAVLAAAALAASYSHRGRRSVSWIADRTIARMRRSIARQAARSPRLGALLAGGGDAVEVVARALRDRAVLASGLLLSVALLFINGGVQWVAFRALELPVGWLAALVAVSIGGVAGVIAGTPGGAGGAEAAMIATLAALGVSDVDATVATLVFRGAHYCVTLGLGLPSLAVLESLQRRARDVTG